MLTVSLQVAGRTRVARQGISTGNDLWRRRAVCSLTAAPTAHRRVITKFVFGRRRAATASVDDAWLRASVEDARAALAAERYADAQFLAARVARSSDGDTQKAALELEERAMALARSSIETDRDAPEAYHRWYYQHLVWQRLTWLGVPIRKALSDLWNYQEIIAERKPRLIVEFGTNCGGSALYFAHLQRLLGIDGRVLTVDIDHGLVPRWVRRERGIEFFTRSSSDPNVGKRILGLRRRFRGAVFVVLDSDHSAEHVLAELRLLRGVLRQGDYLIVEDGNINGNPVLPDFGPGPTEALGRYRAEHPDDYVLDREREGRFGFTFAPRAYLVRA
jgi:cephalosporin hydroxylase